MSAIFEIFKMKVLVSVACFAVCVSVCSSHLCLIEPRQRGPMGGLNTPASDDCIRTDAPCGGFKAERAQTEFKNGGNFSIVFQKNLDHWVKETPGYFSVTLMQGSTMMSKELARINDMGEPNLTLYTASGPVPMVQKGDYILQVTYVTKNPRAPAVFYQCADIYIY